VVVGFSSTTWVAGTAGAQALISKMRIRVVKKKGVFRTIVVLL
jgi:hypothetical protein